MTPNSLGLNSANRNQGLEIIPAGTSVVLIMKIRPGNVGIEALCKRSSNGESEGLDCEFTVKGGEHDGRKVFDWMTLDGTLAGHAKAGEISRSKLRAIFEAVHGFDPRDETPATMARRDNATIAGFNGATFLATVEIERGGKRPDGTGNFRDKNVIAKILRIGDQGYRRLEQPPAMPIERSAPPAQPYAATPNGGSSSVVAPPAIAKPGWAQGQ